MRPAAAWRVALGGPMGAGKSSVGRALALRLGVEFIDLDARVGDPVAIFAAEGEVGFRDRETAALSVAARGTGVLALGGGTLVRAENRALLSAWRVVVLLAPAAELRARVGEGTGRPLRHRVDALLVERSPSWAASGPVVATAGRDIAAVVDEVLSLC